MAANAAGGGPKSPVAAAHPPALVLDTNVVLDWLLFADPRAAAVAAAIESGAVRWLAASRMRDEFERTLHYPALSRWKPESERLLSIFDRHAVIRPAPPTSPRLRCSDADDQIFIDLALTTGARWLLTRDRALLRLRRRAAESGILVMPPERWAL